MKTALVFSAGGLFGAYQVGAWKALAREFQPDIVVGASIGSLNGWAIAGGCSPQELMERWRGLPLEAASRLQPFRNLDSVVQELHGAWQPRVPIGVVLTRLMPLGPQLFLDAEITWRHLAASCAIPGVMRQHRIAGAMYSDGGLLDPLPLWAAARMGARRIIAVNVLANRPCVIKRVAQGLTMLSGFQADLPDSVQVVTVSPPRPLGPMRSVVYWDRENIERWFTQGEREAEQALTASRRYLQTAP